jgi:hypothetical protein
MLSRTTGIVENPKEWTHTSGFDDAKEQQLLKMLAYHTRAAVRGLR